MLIKLTHQTHFKIYHKNCYNDANYYVGLLPSYKSYLDIKYVRNVIAILIEVYLNTIFNGLI